MKWRTAIIIVCFAITGYAIQILGSVKPVPIKKSLFLFPKTIDGWRSVRDIPSSDEVVQMLGVTDYLEREYIDTQGHYINLYVGYYHAVGVDGAYHSPKNCLPGGGWRILKAREVSLTGNIKISEMVIQNGNIKQIVFYWYQNRGRIISSEYWEKIYLVIDALTKHRRDGAFVRIIAPIEADKLTATEIRLERFSSLVLNALKEFLPGQSL